MKIGFYLILILFSLQNCYVPVTRDYQGFSKSLVFNQNKKWLINKVYTDLNSNQADELNQKILNKFNTLSNGNATSIDQARKDILINSKISFTPTLEELESLKNNSNFDYLVNIRTKKVTDQIASIEIDKPFAYSKNEAFAIIEIYDLKTLKKIYYQKASSEVSRDKGKSYPEYSGQEIYNDNMQKKDKGPYFTYSAGQLSVKNLNKILKDIEHSAIK